MTPSDDHDLHTLAGAYVLDAISAEERARFAVHLAGCAACREEVRELREAAARLGTAQAVRPRPDLREQTITAAYRTGQLAPVIPDNDLPARPGLAAVRRARRLPVLATAAAAVVAAVGIGIGTHVADMAGQQPRLRAHTVAAVLSAPDAVMRSAPVRSGGMAVVVTSPHEHMAVFIAHGLQALPRTSRYELWLMGPHGERPAGMLTVGRKDMAGPALIKDMSGGEMVGLTVEPASGSLRPTSATLVIIGPGRH